MLTFKRDRWSGNGWASIDIDPVEVCYFPRLLLHLAATYQVKMPEIVDILDGYVADFEVLGSRAKIHVDNWTFSVAFQEEGVRDQVLAALLALPATYFGE